MSENSENILLLSKRNSSNAEVNRSSPNLNTKTDSDVTNIHRVPKVGGDDISQSISKSQQVISTSISMQESQVHNGNIDHLTTVNQTEHTIDESSLSASFKQLSRRESSLENLAEDNMNVQVNTSASDIVVTYFVQKTDINDSMRDFTRKPETSSRFRRTIHSLFSCCSSKTRRSLFIEKTDCNSESVNEADNDKYNNPTLSRRPLDKEHTSLSCLRLRKFFDMLDENDGTTKRVQQTRQMVTSIPYRDGDKNDSPGRKSGDNVQSENGGANLTYSDHDFPLVIPESESLLNVAPFYTTRPVLLGPIKVTDQGKKCFIIDLDETLVHSSFKMVDKADFKVGVDIEGTVHTVYVLKRPYVDVFLQKMGRIFECVLFTASLAKYADPVTDFLDKWRVFRWRLFRESCVFHRGNYVKDLGMLGRLTDQIVILDNSPASYMFHPDSAVQITSWFDDPKDTALLDLIPYFEQLAQAPSVPPFLSSIKPPQRATVPVSVMIPLPNSLQVPSITQNKFVGQSSSPITNVVSIPVTEDISSMNQRLLLTNSDVIQLPFSRSTSPYLRSFTKSLSSLPTYNNRVNTNFSRSVGRLDINVKEQPLFLRTLNVTNNQMRLSKSDSDLPKPLILQHKSTSVPTVHCISASSPVIILKSPLQQNFRKCLLSPLTFPSITTPAHSAPSSPNPISQSNTSPKLSSSHTYIKISNIQSTSNDSY